MLRETIKNLSRLKSRKVNRKVKATFVSLFRVKSLKRSGKSKKPNVF